MRISILCSDAGHPVNVPLASWAERNGAAVFRSAVELSGGDFLFMVSCSEIVPEAVRSLYRHALVLHASRLPEGRGWSPQVWDIIEGKTRLTWSLLVASDPVDSGDVWQQADVLLDGTETFAEINAKLFDAELSLLDWALTNCDKATPVKQFGAVSYRRQRTPADSEISAEQTIAEVFDLLRVSDPVRYPAHFSHRGATYTLELKRAADTPAKAMASSA